jgi:hypothetical protein
MNWELVDHFYIITYENSPKMENAKKQLKYWNIPPEKITWNIPPRLEVNNCPFASASKNHIDAYRHAKKNGYRNIIIFEDDFTIDKAESVLEINYKTNYTIQNLPNYDILYYGYYPFNIDPKFNEAGIIKIRAIMIHAYLISEKFYSLFLDLDVALAVDMNFPCHQTALDVWMLSLISNNKKYESYGIYPQLVYQDNFPLFKKGNKDLKLFKFCCDKQASILYNKDIINQIVFVFIIIIILGKNIC